MTTVKQLEKRLDELEDKIEKLIKMVAFKSKWPWPQKEPYKIPERKKCPCCGQNIKSYYPYHDEVMW